jgi:hypothetical protein
MTSQGEFPASDPNNETGRWSPWDRGRVLRWWWGGWLRRSPAFGPIVARDFKEEMGKMMDEPEPKRSKGGVQMTHLRSATNKKTVVVVTLLVVAMGLCWLSWRVGSPLMTTIRNTDVELELRNELEGLSSTPIYKVPR